MRRPLALFVALLALVALGPMAALAQDGTPEPQPADEVIQVADDTYAFVSSNYVSLFIVTDEGVIATDPASQFDTDRVNRYAAAIAEITDQPVRYLIYSHDHADHATGGAVFSEATFVSHRNAVAKIEALGDANTPVPTVAFDDFMQITLGGTTIELHYVGPNHSDNSVVVYHPEARVAFAVDFIPVESLPFQSLPDFYLDEWLTSLDRVEAELDFDTLVIGHPPATGTKADIGALRGYVEALLAAIASAQDAGLADNSPEMVEAVRTELEADYGDWANFDEWLPLNIEGVLRIQADAGASPEATPAA
jgi:glyoxylase-like metal-dependent hydrolase (beta-lactamase superfamily II)